MANKRKTTTAIVAGVTAVALLLGGTFAWTSISQQAKNEAIVDINPGGRLHDDFNGTNKDVYVENFSSGATGVDIFARIRLDQYFEVGQEAGKNKDSQDERNVKVELGGVVYDEGTWVTYKPVDAEGNPLATLSNPVQANGNWQWTLGNDDTNKPYYMPTFNMNKDSLAADINGTYEGTVEGDIVHYDDYKKYDATSTATGNEVHDWDSNADEEEEGTMAEGFPAYSTTNPNAPIDDAHVYLKEETHTAEQIDYTATVYTMAEWIALGSPVGPYWVYDTDGWAYWAQPIAPGETTGLLLDGINMSKVPDDNYYYGINVVGQFATKGDIYMFDDMSPEAEELFATVSGSEEIVISGDDTVLAGGTATYTATRYIFGENEGTQPASFTWAASATDADGQAITGIEMSTDGTLTVADTVPHGTEITVTATAGDGTATADGETTTLSGTKTVIVEGTLDITAANSTTRYETGIELTETFTANLKGATETDGTVTWVVTASEGHTLTDTTITDGGVLTIGTGETAPKIIVTATYKSNDGEIEYTDTYEILNKNEIVTTDDPEVEASVYAIKTVNGTDDSGADTYKLSFVRSVDEITTANTYDAKQIVTVWDSSSKAWKRDTSITEASVDNKLKLDSITELFYEMTNLKTADLSKLDTSNITEMFSLFSGCTALTTVDVSSWDTSNVTRMGQMFYDCAALTTIDVSTWNTSKVDTMNYMFYNCGALTTIDVSNWDVSSATAMDSMFRNCAELLTVGDLGNWDVSKVRNMVSMFEGCAKLTVDCSNWNASHLTELTSAYNFSLNAPGVKRPKFS